MDATLRKAICTVEEDNRISWEPIPEYVPEGYSVPKQFDDLGNAKNESSFVAVIHIDGNAMEKGWKKYGGKIGRSRGQNIKIF